MLYRITLTPTLLIAFIVSPSDSHGSIILNATDRGQYHNDGGLTADNYAAGDPATDFFTETRNFFVFDLTGVVGPVTSAALRLENPISATGFTGFGSVDDTEDFTVFDVSTSANALVNDTAGVDGFNDLGSGTSYAVRTVSNADNGTIIEIALNAAAISDLNNASGLFVFGGAITTLNATHIGEREQIFGGTTGGHTTQLVLQTEHQGVVPEPASLIVWSLLGVATGICWWRSKR